MKHFSEADLLETYYTEPGESTPVMMHIAECSECATRYERLERKVRGLAACEDDKPETFWARQRISIMRRVEERRQSAPLMKYAAAAVLTLVLGGVVTWKQASKPEEVTPPQAVTITAAAEPVNTSVTSDPWQSEELKDYQPVVAWESWVEEDRKNGDKS